MFEKDSKNPKRDPDRVRVVNARVNKETFKVLKTQAIWSDKNVPQIASEILEAWAQSHNKYV